MDIIIGGGITGLSYALFSEGKDYLLLEKESELGGYCKTTERNGYVWDYSGHFFHFQDEQIKKVVMDSLCSSGEVVEVDKNTNIKYADLYVDYPFQKNIHQLPKEEFIDCLVDLFTVENEAYDTFKEMLYCKFGRSISEKFLIPYNEKLYACDLNLLDKSAMGRFFPYAEKEQIIRNFRDKNNLTYNGSFLYPKHGAIQYVKEILKNLDHIKIRTDAFVKSINLEKKQVVLRNGFVLSYDRLISTIPFPIVLDMANIDYDKSIYSWNKVLVFNLGFNNKGPIRTTHWTYFPEKKYCFYRVGFYDNILEQDKTSMYVELGFHKDAILNVDDWLVRVLDDLRLAGCISEKQELVDYETIIMDPAYVHITDCSINETKRLKKILASYDVYSIGRYGSWTYCSIEDNIKEARDLVNSLRECDL